MGEKSSGLGTFAYRYHLTVYRHTQHRHLGSTRMFVFMSFEAPREKIIINYKP